MDTTGIAIFLVAPASTLVATDVEILGFGFCRTPTHSHVACNGTPTTAVEQLKKTPARILCSRHSLLLEQVPE